MLATDATASRQQQQQQPDSLAAELDALTDVEALLHRYRLQPTVPLPAAEQSLAAEERQLAVIAQLDVILRSLQATTGSQPRSAHNTAPAQLDDSAVSEQWQQPIERADADEDDLTFLTQLVRSNRPPQQQQSESDTRRGAGEEEEHKESLTSSEAAYPATAVDERAAESEQRAQAQTQTWAREAVLEDGEGFRLSGSEARRLTAIDELLMSLQREEREGKKRRFVQVRGSASRQSGQPSKSEVRRSSLPTLSKPAVHAQARIHRTGRQQSGAVAQPVGAASTHSAGSWNSESQPSLPAAYYGCSLDDRQRLSAVDAQLAALTALQAHTGGDEQFCDWLPLDSSPAEQWDEPTASNSSGSSSGSVLVRPPLPAEQSWLYVSRLRDLYPPPQQPAQQRDDDPFGWLDSVDDDSSTAAAERLDQHIERDSILPTTDSEDDDEASDEKQQQQQRTSAMAWHSIRALPAAPAPSEAATGSLHTDRPTALTWALSADSLSDSGSSEGAHGRAGETLAERERHTAASSEAARRRVRRLIAEVEQRKQQQHASHGGGLVEGGSAVSVAGRTVRVRTSEERSGGALQRKAASVQLSALPQRPPTR